MNIKNTAVLIVLSIIFDLNSKESEKWVEEKVEQVHMGNFALPVSQQPGPLFSFGQNLVDKGNVLAFAYANKLKGHQKNFVEVIPSILYGVTDRLSLLVELPIAAKFKQEQFKSHGISDLIVQLEGVVYAHEATYLVDEITFVGNMSLPTGSFSKQPSTGLGSPSFFLGFTLSRSKPDWYYFTSWAGLITTVHKQYKLGNALLYQFGIGRNIAYKTDGWILNWLVEINGIYRQHDKIGNVTVCNSGGNILLVGPSLFFSTQRFLMQGGVLAVAQEHSFGVQLKDNYLAAAYIGWKF